MHKRHLPRRDSFDPYKVFVSEIMLQQTQVSRVVPKFLDFIQDIPTFSALATCDIKVLLSLRSGLGFNRRAVSMQKAAQIISQEYYGVLPDNQEILRSLPGIGPYTACSLLAFAYNREVPVLDINIKRVLLHFFSLPLDTSATDLSLLASRCIPSGRSSDWHNALMDYGSFVLTAEKTGIASPKQSSFIGSRRQVRGIILKKILAEGKQSISSLRAFFPAQDVDSILFQMQEEGLVKKNGNSIFI